jgi:hypothetical protein
MNNSANIPYSEEVGSFFEEIYLEGEHFNRGILIINCNCEVKVLPVTGLLFPEQCIYNALPKYPYCPDQRLYTFRLLGKDSPGLPPPIHN